jgi:regulator of replication initiation timing
MVRRQVHLEKPALTEAMFEWVEEEEVQEDIVADHQAMKDVINPIYREMFLLCVSCEKKQNPEPMHCADCVRKES